MVRERLSLDPLSGHWFLFRNKRGDRLKILLWDHGGLGALSTPRTGHVRLAARVDERARRDPQYGPGAAARRRRSRADSSSERRYAADSAQLFCCAHTSVFMGTSPNTTANPALARHSCTEVFIIVP